ncbi:MAG: hypothetical protein ACE5GB_02545 [Acidimicrobiales bacterium]
MSILPSTTPAVPSARDPGPMARLLAVLDSHHGAEPVPEDEVLEQLESCVTGAEHVAALRAVITEATTGGAAPTGSLPDRDGLQAWLGAEPWRPVAHPSDDRPDIAHIKQVMGARLHADIATRPAPTCATALVPTDVDDHGGGYAAYVTTRRSYLADGLTAEDLAPYLDPTHWPCCSDFFQAMIPVDPHGLPPARPPAPSLEDRALGAEWRHVGVFNERVGYAPGADLYPGTLLRFWLKRRRTPDGRSTLWLRYELVERTAHIDVDEGDLVATDQVRDRVSLSTTKLIKFASRSGTGEGQSTADLACAMGWLSAIDDLVACTTRRRGGGTLEHRCSIALSATGEQAASNPERGNP